MLLKEIMHEDLVELGPEESLSTAAVRMMGEKVGCILITRDNELKGLLTDRDIARWVAGNGRDPGGVKVSEVMNKDVVSASPDTELLEGSKIMADHNVRRLPIVGNGKLCGIVTISDFAKVLDEEMSNFFHIEETYVH